MSSEVATFAMALLGARLGSLAIYQATWRNGLELRRNSSSAFLSFLSRPLPWMVHLTVVAAWLGAAPSTTTATHIYAVACGGSLALGAIGRWGAVDRRQFWIPDRVMVAVLWIATLFHPIFLYPLLLATCSLQYTVASWPLQPGYSNLLGFEFMRSSASALLSGYLFGLSDTHILTLVLCQQGAGYIAQAVAKSALGRHPLSWVLENRIQFLVVNSWLRGWRGLCVKQDSMMRIARGIGATRIAWCAAVWILEIGWITVPTGNAVAISLVSITACFHLFVWVLTGLACVHYLVSHLAMLGLLLYYGLPSDVFVVGALGMLVSTTWTLLLRRHLFHAFQKQGAPGWAGKILDPADHLMAWWDSPAMRLYSYSVTTLSGRRCHFPVRSFSPYDTYMTDLHTHVMILGKDFPCDPYLESERAILRRGVWGLVLDRSARDRLYAGEVPASQPFDARVGASPRELQAFFAGLNHYSDRAWFRILWRWPHFPGEDQVPDWSPLSEPLPLWQPGDPIIEVACHCVQTFQHRYTIELCNERVFCRFPVEPK